MPAELSDRPINVNAPGELHRQLRMLAAEQGKTIKDVVLAAIREYLAKETK